MGSKSVLRTQVLEARERKEQVAVLFCDLSKAFDVANHELLAVKLARYGIRGPAQKLITEFLQERSQVVVGEGGKTKSDPLDISLGVPQGSLISNVLFSLLMNDLPEAVAGGHIFMYADDVAAVVYDSTLDKLEEKLNSVADGLSDWFKINGLILNLTKTQFIHFNLAGRNYRPLNVRTQQNIVVQVDYTTFLGFQVDRALTWESHIDKLCGKLGRACFALQRISHTLSPEMVRSCYFASVHSLLQYGVEFWGCATDWQRVFRMQKRAVRAIARIPQDQSVASYFEKFRILTLPALVVFQAALYARAHLTDYRKRGDNHRYNMRHKDTLTGIAHTLTKTGRLIHIMAPKVYNRLPVDIKDAPSLNSFKNKLRSWLVKQTLYDYDEWT